jgi:pyrophosphatase PpaX
MARPAPLLFDLDGTLVDTIELLCQSMEFAFADFDGPRPTRPEWIAGIGTTLRSQVQAWARSAEELEWLVARYRVYQTEHFARMTVPYPGVTEVLLALRDGGHPLALVTSKYHALARKVLAHVDYLPLFDVIVGGDSIANPKPHPEPVHKALSELGAHPDEALFIGDSPHDVRAGNAAGVATAACLWGPFDRATLAESSPTHWLTTIYELPALVGLPFQPGAPRRAGGPTL